MLSIWDLGLDGEATDLLSVCLIAAGLGTCFFAYVLKTTFVVSIGALLFGLFLWNEVVPQFANDMLLCYVVGCCVVVVGAMVGGLVALLMAWLSAGVTLGALLALWLLVGGIPTPMLFLHGTAGLVCHFGTLIALCVVFAWHFGQVCMLAAFSVFGGLVFSYGLTGVLPQTTQGLQIAWIAWTVASVFAFLLQGHLSGDCSIVSLFRRRFLGYRPVPSGQAKPTTMTGPSPEQKTFTYPENQAYNYFDPDQLPPALQAYADVTYDTAEQLANFFGFQDDNVRNQVEHILNLVANHRRFCDSPSVFEASFVGQVPDQGVPSTGVHSLHAKLFENYRWWCRTLNVKPKFTPIRTTRVGGGSGAHAASSLTFASSPFSSGANQQDEVSAKMTDIMLMMCIWGEAANLRHMPECLCFLYHKMMAELLVHRDSGDQVALYAGYFLDHVVTPIWEVVVRFHKVKGDHVKARNYDDFNEFFWSPGCLRHSYRDIDKDAVPINMFKTGITAASITPVHKALETAPKTFLEKRSLLSTILTFNRILEFHIVTFYLCSMVAFAELLVWDWSYAVQMLSSVFILINLLGLCWCMLEVWQAFPGINISGTAKAGFLIRLGTRFLVLVYQTLYFMWSMQSESSKAGMVMQGPPLYWWWQFIWLSAIVMFSYVIEAFFQLVPWLTTCVCTIENDYINAFLNLCYPLSRQYVGKSVHEPLSNALGYAFFWITLLAWKMWFSYQYEVMILVTPTIQLFDDYVNFPEQSLVRVVSLIVLRWIPQAFIYLIDTSIWFACWSAVAGSFIGFQKKLGDVRDFATMRKAFMQLPEEFCSKVVCEKVTSRDSSMVDLPSAATGGATSPNATGGDTIPDANASETTSLLAGVRAEIGGMANLSPPLVARFLDVRTQKWGGFAMQWNSIINNLRLSDIISNSERDMLKFHTFVGLPKPMYLPIFQTAGCVERAASRAVDEGNALRAEDPYDGTAPRRHEEALKSYIDSDRTTSEAVSEVWELSVWFLKQMLGPLHASEIARMEAIVDKWLVSGNMMANTKLEMMRGIVTDCTAIFTMLHSSLPRRASSRPKNAAPPMVGPTTPRSPARLAGSSMGLKRTSSASGLSALQHLGDVGGTIPEAPLSTRHDNLRSRNDVVRVTIPDKTRDQVRDKLRPLLKSISDMMKTEVGDAGEVKDLVQMVASLEQGFMWDDTYATARLDRLAEDALALSVLAKLYGLLAVQPSDAEPVSPEAKRRLTFFVNSLFMDMPRAPPMPNMLSWSTVTPYYSEDVLYSRKDLEARNEDGLSTLLYLQALYKHDWHNFLERLSIDDEQQIWSKKNFQDLRMWASMRAQTLFRTVEGIMYYEAALRGLAELEKVPPEQVDALVRRKFQYVVACQVYGRMKKIQDPKADDIEFLLKRFPNLRVAFIDESRPPVEGDVELPPEYFSVLIKAAEESQEHQAIQEVYRVKLPGNPVVGEGKPENQNHSIIFTRGEHVQAIDMNQEGYYEEALKMRCLLQEFLVKKDPPTTIVGFREHIFTGSVSSLANYMALQELSFVTIGQRVLDVPLRIRMHYGHPDVFDKVFFMTRGGMSKASKGINLSEDIFAGYNNTIRGGQVRFCEYAQVGKGRDVGMQQIYKFEAKLAQGAAEQSLSRDTNRLGARLDFFRLVSFYFGGLGYYIGNFITIITIVFVVYFMLALAVFEAERIGERKMMPEGTLQMMLAGMGVLNTLPMLATLMVEKGLQAALKTVGQVFVSGGPMYFMFHIQTRAHYFYQTLLAGGAQYRATGRGFVTHHSTFDDLYRFFAVSHFYLGFELAAALVILACTTQANQYVGRTWSLWLASVSFLFAPFWFNPVSFEWGKVMDDYKRWMRWMSGTGGTSSNSWEVWWREENGYVSKFGLGQKLQCMVKPVFYLVVGLGVAMPKVVKLETLKAAEYRAIALMCALAFVLLMGYYLIDHCGSRLSPLMRRSGKLVITAAVFYGGLFLMVTQYTYVRIAIGLYYMVSAISSVAVVLGFSGMRHAYHIHDFILGHILFLALFTLAALQFPKDIQTWLLFNNALSQGVVIDDILKYARKTQEKTAPISADDEPVLDEVQELRAMQKRLVHMIQQTQANLKAGTAGSSGAGGASNGTAFFPERTAAFTMPLIDDEGPENDTGGVAPASMMRASASTLDLSKMASTSTRRSAQAGQQPLRTDNFQFTAPNAFPPRDT